ncbi:Dead/deah box RNA helicase [Globisporangium polare]
MFRLRSLGFSNAAFRNSVAVTAAAALGVTCGNSGGSQQSGPAFAEASADASESVTRTKDNVWYPNTTTKHWHFYRGKMNPNSVKSLKLFKCADTPIADEIAAYLGVSLNKMEVKRFADGETSILVNDGVRGKRVYIVCSTTTVDRLMELLLSISAMRRSSAKSITAVIPFFGYARQDRMHKGREPVAAADIARMLEVMGVDHVVTVDLHSAQVEGFFKPQIPVDNLQAFPVGSIYFSEMQLTNPIVIAPHSSAVNRAVLFRDILSRSIDEAVPLAFVVRKHQIDKSRPGELVGDVAGKDCIIVDNLVDTGSTLTKTAKVLKSNGAKSVLAFCVHGRFSSEAIKKIEECQELDLLVTTNTIPTKMEKSSKIVTLSVAPFIAEVISCIHTKSSIIQVTKTK